MPTGLHDLPNEIMLHLMSQIPDLGTLYTFICAVPEASRNSIVRSAFHVYGDIFSSLGQLAVWDEFGYAQNTHGRLENYRLARLLANFGQQAQHNSWTELGFFRMPPGRIEPVNAAVNAAAVKDDNGMPVPSQAQRYRVRDVLWQIMTYWAHRMARCGKYGLTTHRPQSFPVLWLAKDNFNKFITSLYDIAAWVKLFGTAPAVSWLPDPWYHNGARYGDDSVLFLRIVGVVRALMRGDYNIAVFFTERGSYAELERAERLGPPTAEQEAVFGRSRRLDERWNGVDNDDNYVRWNPLDINFEG
ncbi:hypothetical protein B0T17DRAFT_505540 [Bombardia bombarda]|uniref:Uncharacterized protein n=1 Tax=Bombardia bombarda TaxID=252184 RepID=A0AA39X7V1_9PEZI|nr:hypothetical protein B0T17DRAFT_505540 [Bombardia bombarda]